MKLKLLLHKHYWFDLKYKIKCFFNPQQEWLTDEVPNTFCDKTELIPRILFACLVNYVEDERDSERHHDLGYDYKEELEKGWVSREYADLHMRIDGKILKAYDYIKTGRDHIEARIDAAYPPSQPWDEMFKLTGDLDNSYELIPSKERTECYKEVNRLEAIKLDKDKWCMRIIIRYHEHLWT